MSLLMRQAKEKTEPARIKRFWAILCLLPTVFSDVIEDSFVNQSFSGRRIER